MRANRNELLAGVAVLAFALVPSQAVAGAAGSFSPAAELSVPRVGAAAAQIANGRVLVAGGSASPSTSAEIFDPALGAFVAAGSLAQGRRNAAAATLPAGKAIVAGGGAGGPFLGSTAIFDPVTNAFAPGSSLTARGFLAAVPLIDGATLPPPAINPLPPGTVLFAGGTNGVTPQAGVEYFNPETGSTGFLTNMGTPRSGAAAAPLPDGRVLVVGGGNGPETLASAEIYTPGSGFSPTGSMAVGRVSPVAAPLPDGRVLVAGGHNPIALASAEVFDPATGTFDGAGIGPLRTERVEAAAAPLRDGRVLVAGGIDQEGADLRSTELFSLEKPPSTLGLAIMGKTLTVDVKVAGTVAIADAKASPGGRAARKKRKPRPSLKPASASGGPGGIAVPLRLAGRAKRKLRRSGRVTVSARIAFVPAPRPRECVSLYFDRCYSATFAAEQTSVLRIRSKKKSNRKGKR